MITHTHTQPYTPLSLSYPSNLTEQELLAPSGPRDPTHYSSQVSGKEVLLTFLDEQVSQCQHNCVAAEEEVSTQNM